MARSVVTAAITAGAVVVALAGIAKATDSPSDCQGSREFLRCDHENSPPVIAGRSDAMASRWARMR